MKKALALCASALFASTASAQVTHWRVVKGPFFEQTSATAPASASSWEAYGVLQTQHPGDATSVTISGGGIAGSLAYVFDEGEWILEEAFADEAGLEATFPSSGTFTVTLSGGTLGTLTQSFSFGTKQYPATPTITNWNNTQDWKANAAFSLAWNDPGPLTHASGITAIEIYDELDNTSHFELTPGVKMGTLVPAGTLLPGTKYLGFLEFTNAALAPGLGGFGIDGTTSHNVALDFPIQTRDGVDATETTRVGTPPNPLALLPGRSSGPILGQSWDPMIDHTSFAPGAVLDLLAIDVGAPLNIRTRWGTLLCNVPPPGQIFLTSPGARFDIALPDNPALLGLTVCTQGVSVTPGRPQIQIELTNALDIVLGSQ